MIAGFFPFLSSRPVFLRVVFLGLVAAGAAVGLPVAHQGVAAVHEIPDPAVPLVEVVAVVAELALPAASEVAAEDVGRLPERLRMAGPGGLRLPKYLRELLLGCHHLVLQGRVVGLELVQVLLLHRSPLLVGLCSPGAGEGHGGCGRNRLALG